MWSEYPCWVYPTPHPTLGYGMTGGRYVHRLIYQECVGPIPHGYQVDHLCRNRACYNPRHLEAVTQAENIRRQPNVIEQMSRTTCLHGHVGHYVVVQATGKRTCSECRRVRQREAYHRALS